MPSITDVRYPIVCWSAWQDGDDYAAVDLIRALYSPNLTVRVITLALLKYDFEARSCRSETNSAA